MVVKLRDLIDSILHQTNTQLLSPQI